MADLAEEATLLLEQCPVPGPVRIQQDGVEDFGRAGQLVERGSTNLAVRSSAERSVSHQTDGTETDRGSSWLRHASYISDMVARREEKKLPKVGGCGGRAGLYTINEVQRSKYVIVHSERIPANHTGYSGIIPDIRCSKRGRKNSE